ncbi:hypothetical protein FA13DRAFT_5503 [Coprinellus micaceus]|uniref:Uncharacterized protein n=1 Tax=Coprinellus micaceus TaxID=71717 RepID=A0A4Y7TZ94_COPMI|nr:hypothetical protein FA13DRAFT_5503 [Coprinellus micaceus]
MTCSDGDNAVSFWSFRGPRTASMVTLSVIRPHSPSSTSSQLNSASKNRSPSPSRTSRAQRVFCQPCCFDLPGLHPSSTTSTTSFVPDPGLHPHIPSTERCTNEDSLDHCEHLIPIHEHSNLQPPTPCTMSASKRPARSAFSASAGASLHAPVKQYTASGRLLYTPYNPLVAEARRKDHTFTPSTRLCSAALLTGIPMQQQRLGV